MWQWACACAACQRVSSTPCTQSISPLTDSRTGPTLLPRHAHLSHLHSLVVLMVPCWQQYRKLRPSSRAWFYSNVQIWWFKYTRKCPSRAALRCASLQSAMHLHQLLSSWPQLSESTVCAAPSDLSRVITIDGFLLCRRAVH